MTVRHSTISTFTFYTALYLLKILLCFYLNNNFECRTFTSDGAFLNCGIATFTSAKEHLPISIRQHCYCCCCYHVINNHDNHSCNSTKSNIILETFALLECCY